MELFSDEYFMKMAIDQAKIGASMREVPVGAVIVSQGKILAKSYNQVEQLQDVTAHAEMLAITSAQNYLGSKYLNECAIYITLEPCVMCAGALYWSQIGKVVYGASDDKRGFTRVSEMLLHPKTTLRCGVKKEECEQLIKLFFKDLRSNN